MEHVTDGERSKRSVRRERARARGGRTATLDERDDD
jgi:hypothetical protein